MEQLETLLRAWGAAYGERPPPEWDGEDRPGVAIHPLARAMDFAPGKHAASVRGLTTAHRLGVERRRMMAQDLPGVQVVPAAFVDPIPCTESRSIHNASRDWPVSDILQQVQRAALDLHRIDTLRGLVLRVNYCTRGTQFDKALAVTQRLGSPVRLRVYRESLAHAKGWMHGRLAA